MDNKFIKRVIIFIILYTIIIFSVNYSNNSSYVNEVSQFSESILNELKGINNNFDLYKNDMTNMENKMNSLNTTLAKYESNVKDIIEDLEKNNIKLSNINKELDMKLEDIRLENEKLKKQVAQRSFF